VVWSVAFTPFLLDLSDTLTVATTAVLAATTWLATVALADWMRRTGRRGPFEVLVRAVTYGPTSRSEPAGGQPAASGAMTSSPNADSVSGGAKSVNQV
jgi:uncharacterized membrane protein YeiB